MGGHAGDIYQDRRSGIDIKDRTCDGQLGLNLYSAKVGDKVNWHCYLLNENCEHEWFTYHGVIERFTDDREFVYIRDHDYLNLVATSHLEKE